MLRAWESEDRDSFIELCNRKGLSEFSSPVYKNPTPEMADAFIKKESGRFLNSRSGKFAVYFKSKNELIGVAGIFEDLDLGIGFEINYRFCSDYWGIGLGSEVARAVINYGFEQLALSEVFGIVRADNFRSKKVLEKTGMAKQREMDVHGLPGELWSIRK